MITNLDGKPWQFRVLHMLKVANGRRRVRVLKAEAVWRAMHLAFFSGTSRTHAGVYHGNGYGEPKSTTALVAVMLSDGGMAIAAGEANGRSFRTMQILPRFMAFTCVDVREWGEAAVETPGRIVVLSRNELLIWLATERLEGRISGEMLANAAGTRVMAQGVSHA